MSDEDLQRRALRSLAPLDDAALGLLLDLDALGVPLWVGWPRDDDEEFYRPRGWQELRGYENPARLAGFGPGRALCANMGHAVAVLDVDPRNHGNVEKVLALLRALGVTIYAIVTTPGGGVHIYIADPSVHPVTKRKWGRVRDYPGVDVQVFGTNVFLPGTARPRYAGRGYTVVDNRLADLLDERRAAQATHEERVAARLGSLTGLERTLAAIPAHDACIAELRQIGGADRLGSWLAEHTRQEPSRRKGTQSRGMTLLLARRGRRALVRSVARAERGNRNKLLLWACRAVENGSLNEEGDDMWAALAEAASAAGLGSDEINTTLGSALNIAMEDR